MRLGLILFRKARNELPYRFRGKNRIVKEPSRHDLMKMKLDFEREEQNMLILRHPYLTMEQCYGHTADIRKPTYFEKIYAEKRAKFSKEITIAERLDHMRVALAWD